MGLVRTIAVLAALVLALAGGIYLGGHPEGLPGPVRDLFVDDDTAAQAEAFDVIKDNYRRSVPDRQLRNGSISGMVRALHDRFSHYFSADQYRLFQQSISGQFSGVGMTVAKARRGLLVTGVYDGTPASRSGIKPGDVITAVNGQSIAGESADLATARIKGKPGTYVTLTVLRSSPPKRRVIKVRRERITIPVVQGELRREAGKKFAHVRVASFSSGVHGQLRSKLDRLIRRGARGVVLDLRQNGGGLLDEAVLVSSIFVPNGVIVTTKGRKRPKQVFKATGDAIRRVPIVVLVDRGTASASEIVTAALHERLGAPVVGKRTFGKGVFGEVFTLSDGGALDLTLGNYYTPSGRNLGGKGLEPDVEATDNPKTARDEALDRALRTLAGKARSAR
jgi:carboxyl-terminal processing protease